MDTIKVLTRPRFEDGLHKLAVRDAGMGAILRQHGKPPFWRRPAGFATLVQIILEQQVSLASARSTYSRLAEELGKVTPSSFRTLDAARLRELGFSRQKAGYCCNLATTLVSRKLDLRHLEQLADEEVRSKLCQLKGVGRWTADVYLLMALRRPDVWPSGDLALGRAVQQMKRQRQMPTEEELVSIAESWRPWRAVAARLLWHLYLSTRKQAGPTLQKRAN